MPGWRDKLKIGCASHHAAGASMNREEEEFEMVAQEQLRHQVWCVRAVVCVCACASLRMCVHVCVHVSKTFFRHLTGGNACVCG